jgi:hypothetical protein
MVTVYNLHPRLGNQLFLIAAAIGLAHKLGVQVTVPDSWQYNNLLAEPFLTRDDRDLGTYKLYEEPRFEYTPLPEEDQLALSGFYQSEKYFDFARDEVLRRFRLKNDEELYNRYDWSNSCSVHVRRGDYLDHTWLFPVLQVEDYDRYIDVVGKDKHFYIFSDDIEWCKVAFDRLDVEKTFVPTGDPFEDLRLMSFCEHHICANSTYSWWGAWLGTHPGKIVTMPRRWFLPGEEPGNCPTGSAIDIYPKGCLRV